MSDTTGNFVWYDLMTTDVDGAKTFYTKLLGWDIQAFDQAPADQPYEMWVGPNGPQGGVMALPEEAKKMGAPPHWLAYTHVADAAATLKKVEGLGGKVLVPVTQIPGGGSHFAVLQDPQGAAFGIVDGEQPQGGKERKGTVTWHELAAADWEKAWAFYSDVFGWKKGEAMDMGPMGTYLMYGNGGDHDLGGFFNKAAAQPVPAWMIYITVQNCDEAVDKAKELGAKVLNGPMDVPGGDRVAQLMDPHGAAFGLHAVGKSS